MEGKDLAYWLADKSDYAQQAAHVLRKQADEIEQLRQQMAGMVAPAAHYPEEFGPSDARKLMCSCGHPEPGHNAEMTSTVRVDYPWIPLTDRFPPRAIPVIVTLKPKTRRSKREVAVGIYWTPGKGHDIAECGWSVDGDFAEVIAWQTAPEPYAG